MRIASADPGLARRLPPAVVRLSDRLLHRFLPPAPGLVGELTLDQVPILLGVVDGRCRRGLVHPSTAPPRSPNRAQPAAVGHTWAQPLNPRRRNEGAA